MLETFPQVYVVVFLTAAPSYGTIIIVDNQTNNNPDEFMMLDLQNSSSQNNSAPSRRFGFKRAALLMTPILMLGLILATTRSDAAQITGRTLTLGSSVASASTSYTFTFTVPSATVVQSFAAQICTTASGACTKPTGFSNAASTLSSQPTNLGDATGWSVSTATDGSLRISKAGNVAAPSSSQTVVFGNVTNPSATNATFFARITTYSDSGWAAPIDTGTVASSTAGQITVTASVDETLTFTLGSNTVALGTLTTGTTGSGTSTMSAETNAGTGYAITVNGTTLTSGANTITALAAQAASSQGTEQFGINLRDNATPNVGTDKSGSGSGSVAANYNTVDQYRFVTGDTVASAAAATVSNDYTVSYVANIAATTEPGTYSTALTYIMSATF